MARGWESKSVEGQIESFNADHVTSQKQRLSPDQVESARKKNGLLLARSRVLQELDQPPHPRRREMLKQALADLEAQLAEFEQGKPQTSS
jgi:hypothetical protein